MSLNHASNTDCGNCNQCPQGAAPEGGPKGWRLVGYALLVFVAPLLAGLIGAVVGGPNAGGQAVGGIVGLLVAAATVGLVVRRMHPTREEAT